MDMEQLQALYTRERRTVQKRLRRLVAALDKHGLGTGEIDRMLDYIEKWTWSRVKDTAMPENRLNIIEGWLSNPEYSAATASALEPWSRRKRKKRSVASELLSNEEYAEFQTFVEILRGTADNKLKYLDDIREELQKDIKAGYDKGLDESRAERWLVGVFEQLTPVQRRAVQSYRKGLDTQHKMEAQWKINMKTRAEKRRKK